MGFCGDEFWEASAELSSNKRTHLQCVQGAGDPEDDIAVPICREEAPFTIEGKHSTPWHSLPTSLM